MEKLNDLVGLKLDDVSIHPDGRDVVILEFENGALVEISTNNPGNEPIVITNKRPGTVYVKIWAYDGSFTQRMYIDPKMLNATLDQAFTDHPDKEIMVNGLNVKLVEDDDHLITKEEFTDRCDKGDFTDYDGFGDFATTKYKTGDLNGEVVPSYITDFDFDWQGFTHVAWYGNKI